VSEELLQAYKSEQNKFNQERKKFFLQLRCLRMNGADGVLAHDFPQFGQMRLNGKPDCEQKYFIEPPPNDKKRHDKFMDVSNFLKAGDNFVEVIQHNKEGKDPSFYALGIFVVMNFEQNEVVKFVRELQPVLSFKQGLQQVNKEFSKSSEEVFCDIVPLNLKDDFTLKPITTPMRGQWCKHINCFDLEKYISSNSSFNNRRWNCPLIPKDKPVLFMIDEFLEQVINQVQGRVEHVSVTKDLMIKCEGFCEPLLSPGGESAKKMLSNSPSPGHTMRS